MAEDSNWGEDTLKQKIDKEFKKFKGLSKEEKKSYYLTYYLVPTIIVVVVIVALAMLIYTMTFGKKESIIVGTLLNVDIAENTEDYLTSGFVEYCNGEKKHTAEIASRIILSIQEDGSVSDGDYNDVMALSTLVMSGGVDYFIASEEVLPYIEQQCIYMSLEQVVDNEFIEEHKDNIVYFTESSTGNQFPAAYCLKNTELIKEYGLEPENSYIVFVSGGKRAENNKKFLEYIIK